MPREIAIEAVALYLPCCITLFLTFILKPSPRVWTAILMATTWQLAVLPWANFLALHMVWWKFNTQSPAVIGMPLSLYLGWTILWGVCAVMIQESYKGENKNTRRLVCIALVLGLTVFDMTTMSFLNPVLILGEKWLTGELVLILFVLIPSLCIARSVVARKNVAYRASQISISFVILLFTILPVMTDENSMSNAFSVIDRHSDIEVWIFISILAICAIPGIAAVRQFIITGKGTPIPFDPPTQIVTNGIYSYIANPMQTSMFTLLIIWGIMWNSWVCILLAIISVIYSQGLATWSEGSDLVSRFGKHWKEYQQKVPRWKYKLRPYFNSHNQPAKLYISKSCKTCAEVRLWFNKQNLTGLKLCNAEDFDGAQLTRITYIDSHNNLNVKGVNAIASAFQHIHIGYAYLGWIMLLPGISYILQISMDASGAGEIKPNILVKK